MAKKPDTAETIVRIRMRAEERKRNREKVGSGKRVGRPRNDSQSRPSAAEDVDTLLGIVDFLTK